MGQPRYDRTGQTYALTRQSDPHIAAAINHALRGMSSVANIGAGAGSYEPPQTVIAVEPSRVMITQRPHRAAPAVQAAAEHLPIRTDAVDAALAVLTIHHWTDLDQGVAELIRIARQRIVVVTWDHTVIREFWLFREYLPAAAETDARLAVPLERLRSLLPVEHSIAPIFVPHDCVDGFGGAYWRRPHAYLDETVQAGMSMLALTPKHQLQPGLRQLRADLESGAWETRHADLLDRAALDLGYRLIVAAPTSKSTWSA